MTPLIEELIRNRWITRRKVISLHQQVVASGLVEQVADLLAEEAEVVTADSSVDVAVAAAILGTLAGDVLLQGQIDNLGGGRRR